MGKDQKDKGEPSITEQVFGPRRVRPQPEKPADPKTPGPDDPDRALVRQLFGRQQN